MKLASGQAAYDRGINTHGASSFYHSFIKVDANDPNPESEVPTSQFFSEGNGGEYRKSFHGYPKGMAQFIDSPTSFHIQPMQIDTNKHESSRSCRASLNKITTRSR
jgi:hypothetical protein